MNAVFSVESSFPPSLASQPLVALLTVASFWTVTLICLQWIYDTLDRAHDHPAPPRSYIRVARRVRLWLVAAALTITAPRLLTLMLWQVMNAGEREAASVISWVACIPAAAMITWAWWANKFAVKTEDHFVEHKGYYRIEPVTGSEKTRGVAMLCLIFVVAFATTFVRPHANVDAPVSTVSARR